MLDILSPQVPVSSSCMWSDLSTDPSRLGGSAMTVYKTSLPDQPSSQRETDASTVSSPSPTPPLAFHGTITSQGFRALRLHGTSLLTASTRRIDVFGRSIFVFEAPRLTISRRCIATAAPKNRNTCGPDTAHYGQWPVMTRIPIVDLTSVAVRGA